MKKYFILGIVILLFGTSIVPNISGVIEGNNKINYLNKQLLKNSFFDVQDRFRPDCLGTDISRF